MTALKLVHAAAYISARIAGETCNAIARRIGRPGVEW